VVAVPNGFDPDILTRHDITGYDCPYLVNRVTALNITQKFAYWSCMRDKERARADALAVPVKADEKPHVRRGGRRRSHHNGLDECDSARRQAAIPLAKLTHRAPLHDSITVDLQMGDEEIRRSLPVYCPRTRTCSSARSIGLTNVEMTRMSSVSIGAPRAGAGHQAS
jgi:hypothetical protein